MVKIRYLFFVLLLTSFALAETTFEVDYTQSLVKITGECSSANVAVGMTATDGVNSIWYQEETSGADKKFSSQFAPSVKGELTLLVACKGDKPVVKKAVEAKVDAKSEPTPGGTSPGGSGGCTPKWDCGSWSFCSASLNQTRECTDLKNCNSKLNKPNVTQSCPVCEENWICSNIRYCDSGDTFCKNFIDEHLCGTFGSRPVSLASCPDGSIGYSTPPAYKPPTFTAPTIQQPLSFWDQYKLWVVSILSISLLLIILLLIIMHYRKPHVVYNLKELEDWITLERNAGTSDEDIHKILADQTGWERKDITDAFGQLGNNIKDENISIGEEK